MAKKKPIVELVSKGIYTTWDSKSRELPKLKKVTKEVPAEVDIEFGYIVHILRAKNKKIRYCIDHPSIPDESGTAMPPFTGEEYVKQNDWKFFIGDTIWEPVENKIGPWRITLELEGELVADETFFVGMI